MTDELSLEGPPTEPDTYADEPPPARWPKVIGIISLIYGICGMLCAFGISISSYFAEGLMRMGGMNIQTPTVLKVANVVSGVLLMGIGIVLISGAVATLRRRRSGPGTLKMWVMLRLTLIVLGVVIALVTAPAQIQFQRSMLQAQQQKIKESGSKMVIPDLTDDQIWRRMIIGIGIGSVVFAVYPLFLGFFLSRQKITDEVHRWS